MSQTNIDTTKTAQSTIKDTLVKKDSLQVAKLDTAAKVKAVPPKSKKPITANFTFTDLEYEQVAVLSNVLRIQNTTNKERVVNVRLSLPTGWKTLNKSDKKYTIPPNDSVFVAIRLLTSNKFTKGGTKYNIIAYVATDDGSQVTATSFLAGRPKITNWQMQVLPRPRIYFLNNENDAPFQINLSNDGDEDQELILTMNKIGKNFILTDSSKKFIKKNYMDFNLRTQSDTTLPFRIEIQKPSLNAKRVDTYGYSPSNIEPEKHFGIFFKASEVGLKGNGKNRTNKIDFVKLAKSVDFVKLNNITKVNPYGSSVIPLTFISNIYNILGQQPAMNIIFLGNTRLDSKSRVDYFAQLGFSYYRYDRRTINNLNGIINYYHEKYFFSVGTSIGLNYNNLRGITNGRGISGGYVITKNQTVGVYLMRNGQSFANYRSTSVGAAYAQKINKIVFGAGIDHTAYRAGSVSNGVNGNALLSISKTQNASVMGQYVIHNLNGSNYNNNFYALNYSMNYLKGRAISSISFNRNINHASVSYGGQVINSFSKNVNLSLTNTYRRKNGSEFRLVDNYNLFKLPSYANNNILFTNVLTYSLPQKSKVFYNPGIYLNYSNFFNERLLGSGIQLSVNTNNIDENFRMGFFLKGGYNRLLDYPSLGAFFTAQTNTYLSYRTWNLFLRYFYGPQGYSNLVYTLSSQRIYNQTLSGSLSKQHQFKNKHFIWENTINYTYLNVTSRHNFGIFSQLFYFTNNGWRFNFNLTYNINVYKSYKYVYTSGAQNNYYAEPTDKRLKNQSFQLGIGVKKNFAIPIPKKFRKTRFTDVKVKAFLDLNGNKKFDGGEVPLENIVLRLNDNEVLSNEKGEGDFLNIGLGKYKIQALSLVDIGAWFPVIPDSVDIVATNTVYIPYSQGVQIIGNVHIEREKYSGDVQDLDISRIKIFLVDSAGKVVTSVTDNHGDFKFYVPYGKYVLKFDEKVLGSTFELIQNDVPVELMEGIESFYHTFFIIEKKRKVTKKKFGSDGKEIDPTENNTIDKNAPRTKKFDADGNLIEGGNGNGSGNSTTEGSGDGNGNLSSEAKDSKDSKTGKNKKDKKSTKGKGSKNTNAKESKNQDANSANTTTTSAASTSTNEATSENIDDAKKLDDLVNILIGKKNPRKFLTKKELAEIEAAKIQNIDFSKYTDKTLFTVQVGVFANGLPQNILKTLVKLNLDMNIESYKDDKDGFVKYFTGKYENREDALKVTDEFEKRGLTGTFVKVIDKGKLISNKEYNKKQQTK